MLKQAIKLIKRHIPSETAWGLRVIRHNLRHICWHKTLWVNLRLLPLGRALRLPILVGRKVRVQTLGTWQFNCTPTTAMVSMGVLSFRQLDDCDQTLIIANRGTIAVGGRVKMHPGCRVHVRRGGVLTLAGRNTIGCHSRLEVMKAVTLGWNSGCAWECQIFDTDFHFLYDIVADRPLRRVAPITIGSGVFIGNHCNIGKGTRLPDDAIVSSWSKVSGSFMKRGEHILISGNPATVTGEGYRMTHAFDHDEEARYSRMLGE